MQGSGQRGEIGAIGDDSPTLRPDWEAGPKHRGEKDNEDRDDTEVEGGIFILDSTALILVTHFGE